MANPTPADLDWPFSQWIKKLSFLCFNIKSKIILASSLFIGTKFQSEEDLYSSSISMSWTTPPSRDELPN